MKDRVGGIDGVHYAPGFTLVIINILSHCIAIERKGTRAMRTSRHVNKGMCLEVS